jgi:hypothetical protein
MAMAWQVPSNVMPGHMPGIRDILVIGMNLEMFMAGQKGVYARL